MPVSQTLMVLQVVPIMMVCPVGSTKDEDTGCYATMRASGDGKYKAIASGEDRCLVYLTSGRRYTNLLQRISPPSLFTINQSLMSIDHPSP